MTCWCGLQCKPTRWPTWNLNSNVFLRFQCQNCTFSNVFLQQMNGHLHMLVRQKSCQSKPDQHVGLICWTTCCPVFAGLYSLIFLVSLAFSRLVNLTRIILILKKCMFYVFKIKDAFLKKGSCIKNACLCFLFITKRLGFKLILLISSFLLSLLLVFLQMSF